MLSLITKDTSHYSIGGILSYDNTSNTPLVGTTIYLMNAKSQSIDTAVTSVTVNPGYYSFKRMYPVGDTTVVPVITKPWGGGNPLDALLINRYYIRVYNFASNLKFTAGDVNLDSQIYP